jgi:hypothetical protein
MNSNCEKEFEEKYLIGCFWYCLQKAINKNDEKVYAIKRSHYFKKRFKKFSKN